MVNQNKALDIYTVLIMRMPDDISGGFFRVVAEQTGNPDAPEAYLTETQLNALLSHSYGGESAIIDSLKETVVTGDQVRLLATAKDPLMLTSEELIRFGFDREDFS